MSGSVKVAVVDYGAANMVSITRALAAVGADEGDVKMKLLQGAVRQMPHQLV